MNPKLLVKKVFHAIAPRTATAVFSASARAFAQGVFRREGLPALNEKVLAEVGTRVLRGPFQGMVLTPMTRQEHVAPFLLGSYEAELHPWWEALLRHSFPQVIDIGAKFGYYAVGLALKFPRAAVVSFDTDRWARRATREMARANGVANLTVSGFCGGSWLKKNVVPNAFIISDCEGYEESLFSQDVVAGLGDTTLLIELHNLRSEGGAEEMVARFAGTHAIRRQATHKGPVLPDLPLKTLTAEEVRRVSTELRGEQEWVLLVPNGRTL